MAEHLTEEEQLQALKTWWKENGSTLITAVLVGLICYFGFQWWQNYQQQQAEQASVLYSELLETVNVPANETLSDEKKATANYLIKQLQNDYSSSQYAFNASLFAGKLAVDGQNFALAEESLLWAKGKADAAMIPVVNLRLARVLVAQEKYDDALSLLNEEKSAEVTDAFGSVYAELRGDILLAKNDIEGARVAYQQSLDTLLDPTGFRQRLLPIKIANLPTGG